MRVFIQTFTETNIGIKEQRTTRIGVHLFYERPN